jgi:hypothetical protein
VQLDLETLDAQVQEKAEFKRREKEADMAEAKQTAEVCNFLREREWEEAEQDAVVAADARATWLAQTDRRERLEADLIPAFAKAETKEIVPEECGISACQHFAGEDTSIDGRIRQQALQRQDWALEKMQEKREAKQREQDDDMQYVQFLNGIDEVRKVQMQEEEAERLDEIYRLKQENAAIARQKALQKQYEKEEEQNFNKWEVDNMMSDPKLAEDPNQAASMLGPFRVRRDHWKGMPPDQVKAIYAQNQAVIDQKKAIKAAELANDKDYQRMQADASVVLLARQREEITQDMEAKHALAEAHMQQKQENAYREQEGRAAAVGEVRDEFHRSFGQGLR